VSSTSSMESNTEHRTPNIQHRNDGRASSMTSRLIHEGGAMLPGSDFPRTRSLKVPSMFGVRCWAFGVHSPESVEAKMSYPIVSLEITGSVLNKVREKIKYGLDMSAPSLRPPYRRSRCSGGENRYRYLRHGSHSSAVGIS
jgi:hypothetical protein